MCSYIYVDVFVFSCVVIWTVQDIFCGKVSLLSLLLPIFLILFCLVLKRPPKNSQIKFIRDFITSLLFGTAFYFAVWKISGKGLGIADVLIGIFASLFLNVKFQIAMILLECIFCLVFIAVWKSQKKISWNEIGKIKIPFVPAMSLSFILCFFMIRL